MTPLLLFAPGAGAPSSSPWMQRYARRLQQFARVVSFDYRYSLAGRRAPDPLPRLIEAHREALRTASEGHSGFRVLAGKSMGGRVGCHLALEECVDALVCFGYPLRGQNGKLRDEVLRELETPVLFVQGTRDPLCPLERLEETRKRMRAHSELYVVEEGNHSLEVPKTRRAKNGTTPESIEQAIVDRVRAFLTEVAADR